MVIVAAEHVSFIFYVSMLLLAFSSSTAVPKSSLVAASRSAMSQNVGR